jgi:hypothetical protein
LAGGDLGGKQHLESSVGSNQNDNAGKNTSIFSGCRLATRVGVVGPACYPIFALFQKPRMREYFKVEAGISKANYLQNCTAY